MIKCENISKAFGGETILEEVSFRLNKGDKCGLVGRNGSGKTTLLRLITGEEQSDRGSVDMPKDYTIGYLTQHLSFHQSTIIQEIGGAFAPEELFKVKKILFGLGFKEEDLEKDPRDFSGGYQLRLHLAKVLLQEPDCLLLDEPTNYLDIVSIRWITRFLSNWPGELLLISHDRDFMDQVTTHVLGIHRKKVKKIEGGTERYYTQLLQEEELYERTRLNLEKKKQHLESFITRFGAKASKATQAQSRKKALSRLPVLEELAKLHHLDFQFPYFPFPGQRLMESKHVAFTYENRHEDLIPDFNLSIEKGDRIAIIGKNGRGKSTLLRLLAQDLKPQKGELKVSPNVKIGFFGQSNIDRLHPHLTIEEEIASASPDLSISEVRGICGVMMFPGDLAKKTIQVLSGGERSRVLLGKILGSSCNLLLLDEPTNHLDMESIEALITALKEFEGSVVIVTHSEMILREVPDKFVICHQGNQHLFLGGYDQFLEKEGWEAEERKKTKKKGEDRHKRAELVKLRAKLLKPLEQKIQKAEDRIIHLEKEVDEECHRLIEASKRGESQVIATLSQSVDQKKKEIEFLFTELENLNKLIEEKNAEINLNY